MRPAIKLALAGPSAFVVYAVLAYQYTAYHRVGPRNPFAARAAKPGHIPQWLIKTGPLPANSSSVRVLLELARARNHGRVQIRYFTDEQSRAHVGAHCGERALAAYDTLIPGSYKADLFRYCILWSDGGVYGDLAHKYHVPLHELVDFERDDLVLARDRLMYNHHVLAHPVSWSLCNPSATPRTHPARSPEHRVAQLASLAVASSRGSRRCRSRSWPRRRTTRCCGAPLTRSSRTSRRATAA
jgi:hypothetical protein